MRVYTRENVEQNLRSGKSLPAQFIYPLRSAGIWRWSIGRKTVRNGRRHIGAVRRKTQRSGRRRRGSRVRGEGAAVVAGSGRSPLARSTKRRGGGELVDERHLVANGAFGKAVDVRADARVAKAMAAPSPRRKRNVRHVTNPALIAHCRQTQILWLCILLSKSFCY